MELIHTKMFLCSLQLAAAETAAGDEGTQSLVGSERLPLPGSTQEQVCYPVRERVTAGTRLKLLACADNAILIYVYSFTLCCRRVMGRLRRSSSGRLCADSLWRS